jgi:PH (Pleckstrin Homology) domain-containing protein
MTDTALFSAPWDQKLTVLTIAGSTLLLLGATVAIWIALMMLPPGAGRILILGGGILSLAALVFGALLAPRGYTVSGDRLTIDRLLRPVEIPLSTIQSVEILPPGRLAGSSRTLGSGGLFGYYGRFRNQALGRYRMYATRGDGYVLVRAAQPFVLTPDSPERFIEAIDRGRARARGKNS